MPSCFMRKPVADVAQTFTPITRLHSGMKNKNWSLLPRPTQVWIKRKSMSLIAGFERTQKKSSDRFGRSRPPRFLKSVLKASDGRDGTNLESPFVSRVSYVGEKIRKWKRRIICRPR